MTALLIGSGCGKGKEDIAKEIGKDLSEQLGIDVEVDCPTLERGPGKTNLCTAAAADGNSEPFKVVVTIVDGKYKADPEDVILASKAEEVIAGNYKAQGLEVKADCGKRIRPSTPGESFTCEVTAPDGATRTLYVRIEDTSGNVDISETPP